MRRRFGRRRDKKKCSNGKSVSMIKSAAGKSSGRSRSQKAKKEVKGRNKGLDGPFWKPEKQYTRSVANPKLVFSNLNEKVNLNCKECGREVKYQKCVAHNGLQNKWLFTCGNKNCRNYFFDIKNCESIPVRGRKKKVPILNVQNIVGSMVAGQEFQKTELFLGCMGISAQSVDARVRLTKDVAPLITEFYDEKIEKNLEKEVRLSGEKRVGATFDGTWMKKGNGKQYDSLNGATVSVGMKSGKVIGAHYMSKGCIICKRAEKEGVVPKKHTCTRNFPVDGSSRSMEAVGCSEIVKKMAEKGVILSNLGKDGDSTMAAKLKIDFPDLVIEEHLGITHFIKCLRKCLYSIRKEHFFGDEIFGTVQIEKILVYIRILITDNQGNETALKRAAEVCLEHIFNNHSLCLQENVSWCKQKNGVSTSNCFHLRYDNTIGTSEDKQRISRLKNVLNRNVFEVIKEKASKLANFAVDNLPENVNNSIHSKGSKRVCYANSVRGKTNVELGILHNNEGVGFASDLLKSKFNIQEENIDIETIKRIKRREKYNSARSKITHSKNLRKSNKKNTKKKISKKTSKLITGASYSSKNEYSKMFERCIDWYSEVNNWNSYTIRKFEEYNESSLREEMETWISSNNFNLNEEHKNILFNIVILDHEGSSKNSKESVIMSTHCKFFFSHSIFGNYCNPFTEISEKNKSFLQSQNVHKLSTEFLKSKEDLKTHLENLCNFLNGKIVIAWNKSYDCSVTMNNLIRSFSLGAQKVKDCLWLEGMTIADENIKIANVSSLQCVKKLGKTFVNLYPNCDISYEHTSWFDDVMAGMVICYNPNTKNEGFSEQSLKHMLSFVSNCKKRAERFANMKKVDLYKASIKFCGCKKGCNGRCACLKSGISCTFKCACGGNCRNNINSEQNMDPELITHGKIIHAKRKRLGDDETNVIDLQPPVKIRKKL